MKAFKSVLLLAALALAAAPALGQTLRPRISVEGDTIRLGDLFASLPLEAAERAIAPAPAPGRSLVFDAASLLAVARDHRLAWMPQTRFDRAVVTRAGRTVTAEEVEAAILGALREQGADADMRVELAQRRFTLTAATGDFAPFEVRAARLDKRDGSVVATLAVREGLDLATEIELRGAAYRAIRIPMLARPMRPGQVVVEDDIAWVETRAGALDSATVFESEGLIGRTPRTALRAGEPLRRTDLVLPVIVSRGDMVTMVLATPTMTLTAKGRATENGAEGQTIKVQNTRSKATVEAVVAGPNRVVVTSPSLAMHQP